MSLQVLGPKPYFWQWDTGQKLVVDNPDCGEVHFDNGTTEKALVVRIKSDPDGNRVAEVPNILLQSAKLLKAYLFQETESGAMTSTLYSFQVLARARPEDYVYTETEVLSYSTIDKRMRALEESLGEEAAKAVEAYLKENPPSGGVDFETDETLKLESGILSVNTIDQVIEDDARPVTSGAVYQEFSKAVALLKTI